MEKLTGSQQHTQEAEAEMSFTVSSEALEENEIFAPEEMQRIARRDQLFILGRANSVHLRFFFGPSDGSKTTSSGQLARLNENDSEFNTELKNVTGNEDQQFLGMHISLSQAMIEEAQARGYGDDKSRLGKEGREAAIARMVMAIAVVKSVFYNHPKYTVGLYVDTVGITEEEDLGRSLVLLFGDGRNTRFFLPKVVKEIEDIGRDIRNHGKNNPGSPGFTTYLEKKGVLPGTSLEGKVNDFVKSSGDELAWRRHWEDIYKQLKQNYPRILAQFKQVPSFEEFISPDNQDDRLGMYGLWILERIIEMGVHPDDFPEQVEVFSPPVITNGVHLHWNRMYGKDETNATHNHQFPWQILRGSPRKPQTYTVEEVEAEFLNTKQREDVVIFHAANITPESHSQNP